MAKKKIKDEEAQPCEINKDNSFDALIKKFGAGVFQTAEDIFNKRTVTIPFSPALDIILGGGIQFGSVIRLTGKEGGGKTVSTLHLAAKAQQADPDVFVVYLNVEGRLKERDIKGIAGLDYSKNRFAAPGSFFDKQENAGKILNAEEYLQIAEWYIRNRPKSFIIIDSISQLVNEVEMDSNLGDRNYGGMLMGQFTKRNCNAISVNDIILVAITHQTAAMSKMAGGPTKSETGGQKIKYATDVGLEIKYIEDWLASASDKSTKIGQIVHWKTNKTALNVGPGMECKSYIRYGKGIDEQMEIFELACAAGFISAKGAWYQLLFMQNNLDLLGVDIWDDKMCKYQGADKTLQALKDNPDWYDRLEKEVRNMFFCQEKIPTKVKANPVKNKIKQDVESDGLSGILGTPIGMGT